MAMSNGPEKNSGRITLSEQSACPNCGHEQISVLARTIKSGSVALDNGAGFAEMRLDQPHETLIVAAECLSCDTLLVEDEEWVYDE